jgi:hypothetical protein
VSSVQTKTLSTSLEVVIYGRKVASGMDWREVGMGPGIFHLDEWDEIGVRLHNIGDAELEQFIEEVMTLDGLLMLNLSENRSITDEGLETLTQLNRLKILNLSSCSITSTGMQVFKEFTHLTALDLSYCNRINDTGLKELKSLINLETLNLQGCSKVTTAGVSRLRRRGLTIRK